MRMYNQWDIVLIPFPFSDLTGQKQRPALIISNERFNEWWVYMVVWIYGNQWPDLYAYPLQAEDLALWIMKKQSYIRVQNIFSIHHGLVIKKIGALQKKSFSHIKEKISAFL